jgi:hypothetical protein
MFSDLDSDDFAKLGKIAGAGLFAISFFLPGVHVGPNYDSGLTCATWTLSGTASFIASVFGPDGPNGFLFFFMVSGWISPLAIVGVFIRSEKARRVIAKAILLFLAVPWIVFAWPQSGWGAVEIHPAFGHYVWTAGCLLIFTPEYFTILTPKKVNGDRERN